MLTGHASFRSWCAACVQGRGRAEGHQGESRKELEDGSKVRRIVGLLPPKVTNDWERARDRFGQAANEPEDVTSP